MSGYSISQYEGTVVRVETRNIVIVTCEAGNFYADWEGPYPANPGQPCTVILDATDGGYASVTASPSATR